MIELDGSFESGGGQIVRTALGLSVFTGKIFKVTNIRQGRKDPGLKKQLLESIEALKKLCNADVHGNELGSKEITFDPGIYKGGKLEVDIETAGSITLFLQSLIIPMIFSKKKTNLTIKGGTDTQWSMPADYFKHIFIPHVKKYADIDFKIIKRGYYPKGQGLIEISVSPKENKDQMIMTNQGRLLSIKGIVNSSKNLQKKLVAERIAQAATADLKKLSCPINIEVQYSESESDGCGIVLWSLHSTNDDVDVILGRDNLGDIHLSSEDVGRSCAKQLIDEIKSGAAVDKYMADNLIPFLGILGGKIKTSEITKHTLANIYVTEKFLDVKFDVDPEKKEISLVKSWKAQYPS